MSTRYSAMYLIAAALLIAAWGFAEDRQHKDRQHDHIIKTADELQWKDGPPSLPSGVQYVVIEGDPTKEGSFTMRLKAPPNYRIPPHTHPQVERVTVLQGTFRLGMGEQFDESKMKSLPAGSFFVMPIGMTHFAATGDEEAIVQLNGHGPWDIRYVNPQDDPRNGSRAGSGR